MAFKNRLLATAAIPLIALMGLGQASAAGLPSPNLQVQTQSLVVPAQADDQELLQQQKKKERQERRQKQNQAQNNGDQGDQNDQGNRKRKNQQDNAGTQQDNNQDSQQPRKKRQQQNDAVQQTQQDDQQQMTPRKKKQNAEVQQIQQDDQQQVTPRRKKQNDDVQQTQQDDQQQMTPRKKKQNADSGAQQDNMNGAQGDDQQPAKPRRKNQNDNAATDQGQSADDKLKNAIDNTNKRHKKNQDQNADQAEQPKDNNNGSIKVIETNKKPQADDADNSKPRRKNDKPVDVKQATDIAADPAKTADTVVLPVENGAAVLDSDKDADKRGADRNRRKREREDIKQVAAPKSDKDAQRGFKDEDRIRFRPVLEDKGQRIPGFKGYDDVGGRRIGDRRDRVLINIGGRLVIRTDDDRRLSRNTGITYEQLDRNMVREVIVRPNGDRIVTVRNRYGEIVRRSRIVGKREVVIIYSPELERGRDRLFLRDPGDNLPPMRLRIPVKDYIIDVSGGAARNYEEFLDEPPVEPVERVYSVGEVTTSARIRDKMRRIDLDTITFETGSSEIAQSQVQSLKKVGAAISAIIDKDPGETFLIEGHTDAVGSDESNLVLSDSRAESIASVLSDAFGIPAENLVTKGYGEQYLKVDTDGPERANRRVTIRRITPLVRPLASSEQ
jgi:outer membrane protein OmpA-like peptidoglycan-associated protein